MKIFLGLGVLAILSVGCCDSTAPGEDVLSTVSAEETSGVNILTSPVVSDPARDPYSSRT